MKTFYEFTLNDGQITLVRNHGGVVILRIEREALEQVEKEWRVSQVEANRRVLETIGVSPGGAHGSDTGNQ